MNKLIQMISQERSWSWSILALVAIVGGLALRALFLKGILRNLKIRNRSWYNRSLVYYEKRSFIGWIFFALFVIGITSFWFSDTFFLKYLNTREWILIFSLLFMISIFFHLRAYTTAIINAVQEHVATDKEI